MSFSISREQDRSGVLRLALRAIRHRRGLRTRQIAEAMGLPLRSYEHFEAGGGQVSMARIFSFADATDSDPFAILVAIELGIPQFAVRCADNKLCQIMVYALQDLDADLGDQVADLEVSSLIVAFSSIVRSLAEETRTRGAAAAAWLARRPAEDGGEPGDG